MGLFSSSRKKQIIGYHYSVGMHMLLCHGVIDGIKQIWVGDKCAWPNPADETQEAAYGQTQAVIHQPNLFGGEDREGGVVGTVDLEYGGASQTANSYLTSKLGADVPGFRGLVGAILRQVRVGTSPYLKPWSFLTKRTAVLTDGGPQWYPAKAEIEGDLNPAHIIRECLTSTQWGLGYTASEIDAASFEAAADTLYAEGFGLSFVWASGESIEDFIREVLAHIDGVLFLDNATGQFKLGLAREDYTPSALTVYNDDDIETVEDFGRGAIGEVPNQVTVRYVDRITNEPALAVVHDVAMIDRQGGAVIDRVFDYPGIAKASLANRVAARELRQLTSCLATMKITGNRRMAGLQVNDVFKLTWPILGISEMIVRVVSADYGELVEGRVRLECVEDVFSAATALYADPAASQWTQPWNDPTAVTAQALIEAPYYTVARDVVGPSLGPSLGANIGYLMAVAKKPTIDSIDAEVLLREVNTAGYISYGVAGFCPTAEVAAGLTKGASNVQITLAGEVDLEMVAVGDYAVLNDEILIVTDVNTATPSVTVKRGGADTVPAAHNAGDRIWFVESGAFLFEVELDSTDTPGAKVLPGTAKGRLAEGDASGMDTTITGRLYKPLPPAVLTIDGVLYGTTYSGDMDLTWEDRNRLTDGDNLLGTAESGTNSRETNQSVTVKIYTTAGTLKRTASGITTGSYTYTEAMEVADFGARQASLRVDVCSVRDGLASQVHSLIVNRSDYP